MLGLDSFAKVALFVIYIALWTNQGILVHLSVKWELKYNVTSAVFLQDLAKLLITLVLFRCQEGDAEQLAAALRKNKQLLVLYLVPASLYALYNNLAFYALSRFDPATYFVLMQFKIVVTAGLAVTLLGKRVQNMQWAGLFVIMLGSMLKEAGHAGVGGRTLWDYAVILVQLLLSAFAGVYTEKLLKGKSEASPNVQNFFMYVDGMALNAGVLAVKALNGTASASNTNESMINLMHPLVMAIIFNAAATGVVTGFFLKTLGSILKTIAAAMELWTTAVLCWIIFEYEIDGSAAFAITLVSAGVWLYSEGGKSAVVYAPIAKDQPVETAIEDGIEMVKSQ